MRTQVLICPKCGHADGHHLQWGFWVQCGPGDYSELKELGGTRGDESIRVTCRECSYAWLIAPLTMEQE